MLNHMTGNEVFRYLLDFHAEPSPSNVSCFFALEMVEIVLHELVIRTLHLAVTCYRVTMPQKSVGSSIALGYVAGFFPETLDQRR